jgi:hypothetical protein
MKRKKLRAAGIVCLIVIALATGCYALSPQMVREGIHAYADAMFCIPRLAREMGIDASYGAIKRHVISELQPGMTHDEVIATLKGFAPIDEGHLDGSPAGGKQQQVIVRLCSNPLNNLVLLIEYSKDDEFIRATDLYEE